jgi:two-component system, chemotaxis family, sensor histidine kinase and response regulator PixL
MSMDKELEIQRQFLDEAQEYLDALDAAVLGLADRRIDPAQFNAALRATHSIKGGAGMMGFHTLSALAHRLEDAVKVLKTGKQVLFDAALENLLLGAVGSLRRIILETRALLAPGDGAVEVDPAWFEAEFSPLFDQLHERLGDPAAEDAASMLGPEDGVDIIPMLFETEVEGCLQRLEQVLATPGQPCLLEEVTILAQELGGLGEMLQLPAFSSLCESVLQHLTATPDRTAEIALASRDAWRSSQANVLTGRFDHLLDHLPDQPPLTELIAGPELDWPAADWLETAALGATEDFQRLPDWHLNPWPAPEQAPVGGNLGDSPAAEFFPIGQTEPDWVVNSGVYGTAGPVDLPTLSDLATQPLWNAPWPMSEQAAPAARRSAALNLSPTIAPTIAPAIASTIAPTAAPTVEFSPLKSTSGTASRHLERDDATVRVATRALNQLNDLFGELAIDRNGMDLYLKRIRGLTQLLRDRVKSLEQSNTKLRAAAATSRHDALMSPRHLGERPLAAAITAPITAAPLPLYKTSAHYATFDALELDRYSDHDLLSQQVLETIVQIQEVAEDIELSLDDSEQTNRNLNKTAKQLQTQLTQLRMQPLSEIADRFPRALRELSLQHGKPVQLKVSGGGTLIDRNILEALADPLLHLLRNAFDHGIEPVASRLAQGKPETGTLELRAYHQGNRTYITLKDDGGGIPLDKIRQRAARMGFDSSLLAGATDAELLSLIFEPGFSTRDQVTALSGRGVGMDVVREMLERVQGEIAVKTQAGQGTTFTLSVPLTLSMIRVLLVESGGMVMAVPTDAISEVTLLRPEALSYQGDHEFLQIQETAVPLLRLARWLHFNSTHPPQRLETAPLINAPSVLLVQQGIDGVVGQRVGLQVDKFWGEQEIALRRIEGALRLPAGFSSCTVLGDGRVVPLVDVAALIQWISQDPAASDLNAQTARGANRASQAAAAQFAAQLATQAAPIGALDAALDVAFEAPFPAHHSHPEGYRRSTILVIDDSLNVRRFLALTLERAGYQVEQAKDGQEALEKLQSGLQVQAILCDIEMPRMDGYSFLTRVKADPQLGQVPIAMLTSRSGDKHRQLAMSLGATAYFSKPYNEQTLLRTLKQWV